MKKWMAVLLVLILTFALAACGNTSEEATPTPTEEATAEPTATPASTPEPTPTEEPTPTPPPENLVPSKDATFDEATSLDDLSWKMLIGKKEGGTIELVNGGVEEGGKCLKYYLATEDTAHYYTPQINIYKLITQPGEYEIHVKIKCENGHAHPMIRGNVEADANSFIEMYGTNPYFSPQFTVDGDPGDWQEIAFNLYVEEEDLKGSHSWLFCFQQFRLETGMPFLIDDFEIFYLG